GEQLATPDHATSGSAVGAGNLQAFEPPQPVRGDRVLAYRLRFRERCTALSDAPRALSEELLSASALEHVAAGTHQLGEPLSPRLRDAQSGPNRSQCSGK